MDRDKQEQKNFHFAYLLLSQSSQSCLAHMEQAIYYVIVVCIWLHSKLKNIYIKTSKFSQDNHFFRRFRTRSVTQTPINWKLTNKQKKGMLTPILLHSQVNEYFQIISCKNTVSIIIKLSCLLIFLRIFKWQCVLTDLPDIPHYSYCCYSFISPDIENSLQTMDSS